MHLARGQGQPAGDREEAWAPAAGPVLLAVKTKTGEGRASVSNFSFFLSNLSPLWGFFLITFQPIFPALPDSDD